MKIRRFFGKDMREALSQVKAELGSDAVIMSNRKVADGIELVAAYDKELVGMSLQIVKALYGLKTSGHEWYAELNDTMRTLGYQSARGDSSVWYVFNPRTELYDYVAYHVDDFIVISDRPDLFIDRLKEIYDITGNVLPTFHLGMDLQVINHYHWRISSYSYIKWIIPMVSHLTGFDTRKKNGTPLPTGYHPEQDTTELLCPAKITQYLQLVGIGQWLVTIGRIDICHAINTMSRYNVVPRRGHFHNLICIFKYLNKYKRRAL